MTKIISNYLRQKLTMCHRAVKEWNSLPVSLFKMEGKIRFKKQIEKKKKKTLFHKFKDHLSREVPDSWNDTGGVLWSAKVFVR